MVSIPNGPHKPFQRKLWVYSNDIQQMFQSLTGPTSHSNGASQQRPCGRRCVSIPNGPHKPFQLKTAKHNTHAHTQFQSLTGPTSHSNRAFMWVSFLCIVIVSIPNGPHKPFQHRGIGFVLAWLPFQSLTGPTSHSNPTLSASPSYSKNGFNP